MAGLSAWYNLFNDPGSLRMSTFGSSTTYGDVNVTNGGWVEQLRVLANTRWGRGGDGFQYSTRNLSFTSGANAWTTSAAATDAFDSHVHESGVKYGSGSGKIVTYTVPTGVTVKSFEVVIIDGASSADMSYRLNGAGSWVNCGFIGLTQGNTMKKSPRIAASVSSTIEVRCANAAGTSVTTYFAGIIPYTDSPGLIIDNISLDGLLLRFQERTRAGGGLNHAYANLMQPKLATVMYTNDVVTGTWTNAADHQAFCESFCDSITTNGGCVLFMCFWGQDRSGDGGDARMLELRNATKAAASNKGMPVLDLWDIGGDLTSATALGYMGGDAGNLHETDAGAVRIAQEVWKIISHNSVGALRPK